MPWTPSLVDLVSYIGVYIPFTALCFHHMWIQIPDSNGVVWRAGHKRSRWQDRARLLQSGRIYLEKQTDLQPTLTGIVLIDKMTVKGIDKFLSNKPIIAFCNGKEDAYIHRQRERYHYMQVNRQTDWHERPNVCLRYLTSRPHTQLLWYRKDQDLPTFLISWTSQT